MRRCDVVNRFGSVGAGGIVSKSVVEVPRDRMASPGIERPATVAGLSRERGNDTV